MKNLKLALHHIVFLFALVCGSVLIYFLNQFDMKTKGYVKPEKLIITAPKVLHKQEKLTKEELEWAKVAWKYFENNYNKNTGLVNSIDNYPSTTMWDTGNYIMALISAYRLNIISENKFDTRLNKILTTLANLHLYKNKLPNKVYNTQSLTMTDYKNSKSIDGLGWSAIDIARLLSPLYFININYPKYGEKVGTILAKWKLKYIRKRGRLQGAYNDNGVELLTQEGRLGYEQYSANIFALFAIGLHNSMRYNRYLGFTKIYDIEIPYDIRDKALYNANNYVVMEPYILDGLELGWNYYSREFTHRLYKVQEKRYEKTNILTAVTEDNIDQKPYFLYNSIYVNKKEWVSIDESGKEYNDLKVLSTKASFGMYVLYNSEYTEKLINKIKSLQSDRGWYAGYYEKDWSINKAISCNTNALILEALLYKVEGALLKIKK